MNNQIQMEATKGFSALGMNPYPGRIIIVGLDETGENLVQIYAIMGRSKNSRNRIFSVDDGRLFTEAANPKEVADPSFIIYNAMMEKEDIHISQRIHVVSNGAQTDRVADSMASGDSLGLALSEWEYEPDSPNFTPRITAFSWWKRDGSNKLNCHMGVALLRKAIEGGSCDQSFFFYDNYPPNLKGESQESIPAGYGVMVHTYLGEGDPLPAFRGEPRYVPLEGNIDQLLDRYWEVLNKENRISLAVKFIPPDQHSSIIRIKNQYAKI